MTRVYQVFDKLSIIAIIIGLVLGFYLAINHNSSNLWFDAIPFIILIAIIITAPTIFDALLFKEKHNNKFPTRGLIEAFLLNIAILAVCTAFGIAIGSFYVGNYIVN